MKANVKEIVITEYDLKKIFALFTSCTQHEKEQIFDADSVHYFENVDLSEEYELSEEKREFALDAWRAVMSFLDSEGYSLVKGSKKVSISSIAREFVR